jgi:hypothetical protein
MNETPRIAPRTIALAAAALIVLAGCVWYFFGRTSSEEIVGIGAGPSSGSEAIFIALATQLGTISFDTAIFGDPRFSALQDIHTNVVPEAAGRRDPFAPLSGVSAGR